MLVVRGDAGIGESTLLAEGAMGKCRPARRTLPADGGDAILLAALTDLLPHVTKSFR